MFRFLPEQASTFAADVDWIHNWITDLSVFFTVAIFGAAVYYAIRYRQKGDKPHPTPAITGDHRLEVIWTVVPTIIIIFIAAEGYLGYKHMRTPPKDTLDINVTAKKWDWTFEYSNGKKLTDEFVVPVDRPVKIILQSRDVLHSFFIPEMRVKKDAVPGMYTWLWFQPIKTGNYRVFCTEYCGDDHSGMMAQLKVVSRAEYDRWINDRSEEMLKASMTPSKLGRKLYQEKNCNTCHNLTDVRLIGPGFKGLWGKNEALENGETILVDENYIKTSLLNPDQHVVKGYGPKSVMPSQQGLLSDDEISAFIAFIKDLDSVMAEEAASGAPVAMATPAAAVDLTKLTPEERGKAYYSDAAKFMCVACHTIDGSPGAGPTFKGLYGRKGTLSDGSSYTADDAYLIESIKNSQAKVVQGFAPAMPVFGDKFTEAEIKDLIAFIKSLK